MYTYQHNSLYRPIQLWQRVQHHLLQPLYPAILPALYILYHQWSCHIVHIIRIA